MENGKGKFLVDLLEGVTQRQMFVMFWVLMGGFFALLFWNHFRKLDQRNFKEPKNTKAGGLKPLRPSDSIPKNRLNRKN